MIPINAYYQTDDPSQSKYYWGTHPTQMGAAYDPAADQNIPGAGTQGWGAQTTARAPTAEEILQYYGGATNPYDPYSYSVTGPVVPKKRF
jgi:hypothetical protein